jgi:hypothetical protein
MVLDPATLTPRPSELPMFEQPPLARTQASSSGAGRRSRACSSTSCAPQ